jgi:hypothetical protein
MVVVVVRKERKRRRIISRQEERHGVSSRSLSPTLLYHRAFSAVAADVRGGARFVHMRVVANDGRRNRATIGRGSGIDALSPIVAKQATVS